MSRLVNTNYDSTRQCGVLFYRMGTIYMSTAADSNGPILGPNYSHLYVKGNCKFGFQSISHRKLFAHYHKVLNLTKYNKFAKVMIIYYASKSQSYMKEFPSIANQKVVLLTSNDVCSLTIGNACAMLFKKCLESEMRLLREITHTPLLNLYKKAEQQMSLCEQGHHKRTFYPIKYSSSLFLTPITGEATALKHAKFSKLFSLKNRKNFIGKLKKSPKVCRKLIIQNPLWIFISLSVYLELLGAISCPSKSMIVKLTDCYFADLEINIYTRNSFPSLILSLSMVTEAICMQYMYIELADSTVQTIDIHDVAMKSWDGLYTKTKSVWNGLYYTRTLHPAVIEHKESKNCHPP